MEGHPYFSLAIHYEQSSIESHQVQSISLALFCLSRSVRSTQLCCILLRSQVNELPTQEDTVVAHRAGSHLTSLPNPVLCPSHAEVSHTRDHLPGEEATGTKGAPPPGRCRYAHMVVTGVCGAFFIPWGHADAQRYNKESP